MYTLINADDVAFAKKNIIEEGAINRVHLNMLVDSGAYMMAINETIQSQLELSFIEKKKSAGGRQPCSGI